MSLPIQALFILGIISFAAFARAGGPENVLAELPKKTRYPYHHIPLYVVKVKIFGKTHEKRRELAKYLALGTYYPSDGYPPFRVKTPILDEQSGTDISIFTIVTSKEHSNSFDVTFIDGPWGELEYQWLGTEGPYTEEVVPA